MAADDRLTVAMWRVLFSLADHRAPGPGSTGSLKALETRGLVVRHGTSGGDLTPRGKHMVYRATNLQVTP